MPDLLGQTDRWVETITRRHERHWPSSGSASRSMPTLRKGGGTAELEARDVHHRLAEKRVPITIDERLEKLRLLRLRTHRTKGTRHERW